MQNKVRFQFTDFGTATLTAGQKKMIMDTLMNATDVQVHQNDQLATVPAGFEVDYTYQPDSLVFDPSDVIDVVSRQDRKAVAPLRLPKATAGQGLATYREGVDDTQVYFENSIKVEFTDAQGNVIIIRWGVSNFTQTEDNNPFSGDAVNNLYYAL